MLKDQLSNLDFTCFLDKEECPAGQPLTTSLRRAVRNSAMLVLIGTPGALSSSYVRLEVEEFRKTGRTIIPIDVDGAIGREGWDALTHGETVWLDESRQALERAIPSPQISDGILMSFRFTRRNTRRRISAVSTAVLFVVLSLVAAWIINSQVVARQQAAAQAQAAEKLARDRTVLAEQEFKRAEAATLAARTNQQTAVERAREATEQQRLAEAKTRLAQAHSLAYRAEEEVARFPQRSLLLAVEAARLAGAERDLIVESALRDTLWRVAGRGLGRTQAPVSAVAASQDGRWLAAAGGLAGCCTALTLWDRSRPYVQPTVFSNRERIAAIAITPDSRWLAAPYDNKTVVLWRLDDDQPFARQSVALPVEIPRIKSLVVSSDSRWLAIAGQSSVIAVYDLKAQDPLKGWRMLKGHDHFIEDLAFAPDSSLLASTGFDQSIRLWDLASPEPTKVQELLGHGGPVFRLAFAGSGRRLASTSRDRTIRVWDLVENRTLARIETQNNNTFIGLAASADYLAGAMSDGSIYVWGLNQPDFSKRVFETVVPSPGNDVRLTFTADGETLIASVAQDLHLWHLGVVLNCASISLG